MTPEEERKINDVLCAFLGPHCVYFVGGGIEYYDASPDATIYDWFTRSLDTCAMVEAKLTLEQREDYCRRLRKLCNARQTGSDIEGMLSLTPAQRAAALAEVVGE